MSIINNPKTDPNKILPMHYKWARQHYKDGVANNWTPEEVSMQKDVEQWKSDREISLSERAAPHPLEPGLLLHRRVPDRQQHRARGLQPRHQPRGPPVPAAPGLRRGGAHRHLHLLLRHLGLDPDEIYNMYKTIPSIKEKDDFVVELTKSVFDPRLHHRGHREHPASSCTT